MRRLLQQRSQSAQRLAKGELRFDTRHGQEIFPSFKRPDGLWGPMGTEELI
jgi:hypothetical protein